MRLVAAAFLVLLAATALRAAPALAVVAGKPCGEAVGATCDRGLWCEPAAGSCSAAEGVCVAVPRLCVARRKSKSFHPVCGCNHKTYSSDCFRRAYRIGKLGDGKCSAP